MSARNVLLLCLLASVAGCGRPAIRVFAAASTQKALNAIAAEYRAKTGTPVECEFAASSTLARQIENGAPADLFLSADEEWADYLAKKGLVEDRRPLLTNQLVVAVSADRAVAVTELTDLASAAVQRLAIAGEAVPAGRYARQALHAANVWQRVEGRLLEGKDVTAVLLYVARGEADAGFVYRTDAAANSKVRIAFAVPQSLSGPVRYPLVRLRRAGRHPDSARFADYLAGEEAGAVFRQAGFGSGP